MTLRPFAEGDEEQVVALWDACGLLRPWNDPHEDIARKRRVQPELFLVAAVDREVIGTAMAGYDGHRGWLYYVAVSPARQGQGVGRALVATAEEGLRAMGCPKLNLQVRAENEAVAAFYARLGYQADRVSSLGKRL